MMDELAAGSVDLITSVSGGTLINAGLDLVDEGKVEYTTYLRNGYGKLVYICDFGPTQFPAVRQAIAYSLDRNEFAKQYSGGYAQVVNGYYGLGQWEYQMKKAEIDSQLNSYTFDLAKAEQCLVDDGWTLNAKGEEYKKGTDDVRYKMVDGELMACEIQWGMVDNEVSKLLATMLPDNLAEIGIKLVPTSIDFSVLLNNLSREGIDKPVYHMFNMGVTFARENDCSYYYNTDKKYDQFNNNKIYDQELSDLATAMIETDSSDKEGYADKWLEFEKRWNELLPDLPLYSDEYHEFFNPKLKNYETSASWGAREQLIYCYVE